MGDVDGAEEIRIHEFVTGCLRAKTLTKPMDTMTFLRETKRTTRMQRDKLAVVEHHINHVAMKLDALEKDSRARQEETFAAKSKWHRMKEACSSVSDEPLRMLSESQAELSSVSPVEGGGRSGRRVVFPSPEEQD